jgi:SAM-dependent methyltransferase
VSFVAGAEAYDRFMGRYSVPLAPKLADFADVAAGQRVLDVGCGPGALTTELVDRVGADAVAAVDPTEAFVEAARERHPGVDIRVARAEQLPFADASFDAALAQLVVHFMADPVGGLRDMARVTREEGVVAACVWDHAGGQGALSVFWEAARELDPDVVDETSRRARWRSRSSIRASTSGGSRSRSASAPPDATPPGSMRSGRAGCASSAASGCRSRRSRLQPARGQHEADPKGRPRLAARRQSSSSSSPRTGSK